MSSKNYAPIPVFDTMAEVLDQHKACYENDNPG